ncbi:hypothetical protein P308_31265 [Pseudomonas piscis]|nr:hypothetical protein P308_31265 [Pseudomonas piscis]
MAGMLMGLERLQLAHGGRGMAVIVIVIVIVIVASMGLLGVGLAWVMERIAHRVASI